MKNFFLGSLITILLLAGLASSNLKAEQVVTKNVIILIIDNSLVVIPDDGTDLVYDDDE